MLLDVNPVIYRIAVCRISIFWFIMIIRSFLKVLGAQKGRANYHARGNFRENAQREQDLQMLSFLTVAESYIWSLSFVYFCGYTSR